MSEKQVQVPKKLPRMDAAYVFSGLTVGVSILALSVQAFTSVNFGEAEWIFVTLIVRELLWATNRVVRYYTPGVSED